MSDGFPNSSSSWGRIRKSVLRIQGPRRLDATSGRSPAQVLITSGGNDLADDVDPTRILIRQMLSAVAQFDRLNLVRRLIAARDRIAERTGKRPEGRKPYGAHVGEDAVIARARALLASHVAGVRPQYAAVARELNAEGMLTRTGVPWSAAMVRRVLTR